MSNHTPSLLTEWEQRAVLADLMGLECLINYHDCQEVAGDAIEPGWGNGNARRALELLKLGREIIAADPDLWHPEQKAAFSLRFSERAALAKTTSVHPTVQTMIDDMNGEIEG